MPAFTRDNRHRVLFDVRTDAKIKRNICGVKGNYFDKPFYVAQCLLMCLIVWHCGCMCQNYVASMCHNPI